MYYKTRITCVSSLQLQEPGKLVKRNAVVFVILKNNRKPSKTQFFTVEKQIFGAYEIGLFSPKHVRHSYTLRIRRHTRLLIHISVLFLNYFKMIIKKEVPCKMIPSMYGTTDAPLIFEHVS